MKIFISADIEGVTGVTDWRETRYGGQGYEQACEQMSLEVAAACRAAMAAGYEVVVKDGHEDALNIDARLLPAGTQLLRGWMCTPLAMMAGLDDTYSGVIYIGYHSGAYTNTSPLRHTVEDQWFQWVKINGVYASEFMINAQLADYFKVPSIFISGDKGICETAKSLYPYIETVSTKTGIGGGTWNMHPQDVVRAIEEGVAKALTKPQQARPLAPAYELLINYKEHTRAQNASWYPGARLIDPYTVAYSAKDPFEMAIARSFIE